MRTTTRIDSGHFRRVLGALPTGVVIVSAIDRGEPVGFTVGAFCSVSLDPALVGFFPSKTSTSWPRIERTGLFVANVLSEDQHALSSSFALSGGAKFADVLWRPGHTGAPVIGGVAAWVECAVESVTDAGDHVFVLARVLHLGVADANSPLVFVNGHYQRATAISPTATPDTLPAAR